MSYKIVVDSCCELPEEYKKDSRFQIVPLGIQVGDWHIQDDENFNQTEFLERVAACEECPKSSCPSPEMYMHSFEESVDRVYVVTLSAGLSGSHNSAVLGKNLYEESHGSKKIHIVDSQSASCGETQIALKAMELEESGKYSFEEIVQRLEEFRDKMVTYFVLDNLETLRKNGRLTGVKALVASTLNIKPIMQGDKGLIAQAGQAIGIKKALARMADMVVEKMEKTEERILMISHCNNLKRAETVRDLILKKVRFKEVKILDTAGISSLYAADGGVIVTV
ncbi:MAG: DegV family protein [Lachnospiraceae bacterium]|nr:DegV family protein [Lachnospiraceae bacterium]MDY5700471.1 DegV family protein [Lachnospiraceae bacterium]